MKNLHWRKLYGPANNGNVMSQKITVPGMTYPLIQSYTYDELNRIANATETSNLTQTWTQVFGYDRYGNRNITSGTGQTSLTFGSTTNRITTSGYSFDSAGNTTADPSGKAFTYDAENKQTKVTSGGGTLGKYWYDGDGKRVKKDASTGDDVIFIFDAAGKLIEERNLSGTLQTSYVYAGGRLLSKETEPSPSSTTYLTADHLGSPRINTNGSGNVVARHDYHPFGEEIDGSGGRTTGLGYQADGVRNQFTGYERDIESDLDFAQARYYNKNHGRFTGVDPLLSTGSIYNPQTWNRYSYTLNSPLKYTDPSGMYICDGDKKQCKTFEDGMKKAQAALKNLDSKSDQYKALDRALKTYGAAGVDNGLTIKFGATVTGAPAETSGLIREDKKNLGNKLVTADNPSGRDLIVTFDPKQFSSASDYAGTIGHEGSHVADRTDFIGALPIGLGSDAATKMFESSPLHLTKYDTESRAYGVSASVARGQGFDSLTVGKSKHEIWNSGWREADRMKKQTEGIDKILAEPKSKGGLYEVTKANPGPRFYD